jgi:hypothetical protein
MKSDRGLPSKQSFEPLANFLIKNKNAFGNMRPIADRVIIKPAPAEDKTKGGIIIPDTAKEKPQRGEVIAVGPGKPDDRPSGRDRALRQVLRTRNPLRRPGLLGDARRGHFVHSLIHSATPKSRYLKLIIHLI